MATERTIGWRNNGLPGREVPGVQFVSEPARTHRQLEVAHRDVREGELPIVAGNDLSIRGFILRSEPDYRAHTHRSRLIEDCANDGSRRGRLGALILCPLLRHIRRWTEKSLGRSLSGQKTGFDRPPVCALALVQQINRTRAKLRPKSLFAFENFSDPTRIALRPFKTNTPRRFQKPRRLIFLQLGDMNFYDLCFCDLYKMHDYRRRSMS